MEKYTIFSMGRGWQGTVNSSVSVNRRENLSLHPPPPPCFITVFFLCGSWTPQMLRNGKWSDTMAFKALLLPCPSLFMFYPNEWWSRKQEAKLRNKNTRDQMGLITPSCWTFFFFFLFLLPTKWSLGLLTEPPYIIIFTSLHQKNNSVSE